MQAVTRLLSNDHTLPISSDETVIVNANYSSAVHNVVVLVNTGVIGLLQLMNQQSPVLETHKPAFLCFCVSVFLYAVFRVGEAIQQLRPGIVQRLFGHMSHLLGGVAAIVMTSVVFATFARVLLLLWIIWLLFIVYWVLDEFVIHPKPNESAAAASPPSPV